MALVLLPDIASLEAEFKRLREAKGATSNLVRICKLTAPLSGTQAFNITLAVTAVDAATGDIIRFDRYLGRVWAADLKDNQPDKESEESRITREKGEALAKEVEDLAAAAGMTIGSGLYLTHESAQKA